MSFGWPRLNKISPERRVRVAQLNKKIVIVLLVFFAAQIAIGALWLIYFFSVGYL